ERRTLDQFSVRIIGPIPAPEGRCCQGQLLEVQMSLIFALARTFVGQETTATLFTLAPVNPRPDNPALRGLVSNSDLGVVHHPGNKGVKCVVPRLALVRWFRRIVVLLRFW